MRKIIHIFLSLVIVYAGTVSAYANTSVGGWTATDTIIAGANTTINATKTAGGKVLTSAVTVAPSVTKLGKFLIKGGGTAALLLAVPQLIGDGVDWVLDPANNRIKYSVDVDAPTSGSNYGWTGGYAGVTGKYFATAEAACRAYLIAIKQEYHSVNGAACYYSYYGQVRHGATFQYVTDPNGGGGSTEERSIPIDTVAAQVISNAESGHAPSQEAVKAVALEGFAAGEHDAALESAAVESDSGTDNPTDPNNPAPTDPAAPFDPAGIISAINALKALLAGILSSITGLSDLFNDTPPEKTQEETDVPVEAPPEVKNPNEFDVDYIGFSSQCPTLQPFSVGIGAASSSMTFDMTPLCELAVTIRPAIIAIAYFIGLGVIASAIRET